MPWINCQELLSQHAQANVKFEHHFYYNWANLTGRWSPCEMVESFRISKWWTLSGDCSVSVVDALVIFVKIYWKDVIRCGRKTAARSQPRCKYSYFSYMYVNTAHSHSQLVKYQYVVTAPWRLTQTHTVPDSGWKKRTELWSDLDANPSAAA